MKLVCPKDQTLLIPPQEGDENPYYYCPECNTKYPVIDGVIRFLDVPDEFYEGAYLNTVKFKPKSESWMHVQPLKLIANGYLWKVRQHVPAGSTVIEFGCAAGVHYFGDRYNMIGLDLSHTSLTHIKGVYDLAVQADAGESIPFADESIDAILSSFFWEHIPRELKLKILDECARVLKPDGKLIFLYDVETDNSLINMLKKRDIALYKRLFLDGDGHFGYETPQENAENFHAKGWKLKEHFGMERTWAQSQSVYTKIKPLGGLLGMIGKLGGIFNRSGLLYLWFLFIYSVDQTIGKVFPLRKSRIIITVAEKANSGK